MPTPLSQDILALIEQLISQGQPIDEVFKTVASILTTQGATYDTNNLYATIQQAYPQDTLPSSGQNQHRDAFEDFLVKLYKAGRIEYDSIQAALDEYDAQAATGTFEPDMQDYINIATSPARTSAFVERETRTLQARQQRQELEQNIFSLINQGDINTVAQAVNTGMLPKDLEGKVRERLKQYDEVTAKVAEKNKAELDRYYAPFRQFDQEQEGLRGLARIQEQQRLEHIARYGVEPGEYPMPAMPEDLSGITAKIESLYPNLSRYWQGRERELYAGIEGARKLWWESVHAADRAAYELSQREGTLSQLQDDLKRAYSGNERLGMPKAEWGLYDEAERMGMPADEPQEIQRLKTEIGFAQEDIESRRSELRTLSERPIPTDPLQKYLAEFPFQEQFLRWSPRQRGFYPGQFSPVTQWRV